MDMSRVRVLALPLFVVVAMLFGSPAMAARPKNATAQCNDGTYSAAKNEQGACSRHGGIQTWFGNERTPAAASNTPAATVRAVPRNATAKCNDGTFSTAKTRQGACSRH